MTRTPRTMLLTAALLVSGLITAGCSKNKTTGQGQATPEPNSSPGPGDLDCYKTAGAAPCPADPAAPASRPDGSELNLPSPGGHCSLPTCGVCGSATAPAFKDRAGMPQPGWCICVAKSDDSGNVYSCFSLAQWQAR